MIIQDELHLISGPLGTVAGLYEAVVEKLSVSPDGKKKPKIIASTATIRRASTQVKALFGRERVEVFPPPGPSLDDSFFARTDPDKNHARLYLGLATPGRSQKVGLLRAMQTLLSAGRKNWDDAGGSGARDNPADPYMTLLAYFNSLRELGGARRMVEDEIYRRLLTFSRRRRLFPDLDLLADRQIHFEPQELTSRVSTDKVAEARQELGLMYKANDSAKRVDVALATNMISVGLDVTRLGLMTVYGQPKTMSEYIQATSRVGRDDEKPGLILTLLNAHRPRDRSFYEHFPLAHAAFYREVEAASVTPFSARARDRSLAAALVGLCRHAIPELTASDGSMRLESLRNRPEIQDLLKFLSERAGQPGEAALAGLKGEMDKLMDEWLKMAADARDKGGKLYYQKSDFKGLPGSALIHDWLETEDLNPQQRRFRMSRSMRDVEPNVQLNIRRNRS